MKNNSTAKSILVIDDEKPILKLLTRSLSKHGYDVDTAENGKEGIRKIENNDYSLILTDIKMPDVSGNQILDHLRNKINCSTPVVGMSGTPWLLDQSDFNAVLQKPYSLKDLLGVIHQFAEK